MTSKGRSDECAQCGAELPEEAADQEARACRVCGSTVRVKYGASSIHGTGRISASGTVIRLTWDGLSLTLAGIIFSVVLTIVGVIVAIRVPWAWPHYGAVSLALLAAGLWRPRPVIRTMKRLFERAGPSS